MHDLNYACLCREGKEGSQDGVRGWKADDLALKFRNNPSGF